jgi:hypothetical protein
VEYCREPFVKPQAIAGVSAGAESELESVYPSIAATSLGRLIGVICDAIPLRIGGIKLSALLFALPLAPVALLPYAWLKLLGQRYVVTNRAVRVVSAIGVRLFREIPLGEIDNIAVDVLAGQAFYHAGDLVLLKGNGDPIARLDGVARPYRLRQLILDAREARRQSDASLATIRARQPQPA